MTCVFWPVAAGSRAWTGDGAVSRHAELEWLDGHENTVIAAGTDR
jgi:hypothetical protein